jgi:protein-S-isoprenylcysteine O-methyltransferase Ste14
MDPINLLAGINFFVSMSANISGAKKGMKATLTNVKEKPKSFLQKFPPNVAAIVLILIILGVFKVGTFNTEVEQAFAGYRVVGLVFYIVFSWVQVSAYKKLGNSYTQEVVILKKHELVTDGIYKYIRHPQYFSQLLCDLGAGVALLSYLIIPVVLLLEIPLFIMRAALEDKMMEEHFGEEFVNYKRKSGFFLPYIG